MGRLRLVAWLAILMGGLAVLCGIYYLTNPGWTMIAGGIWLSAMGLVIVNAMTPKREDDS